MSDACATPMTWETMVDYWANDLPEEELLRLEEHLMSCSVCAGLSARVAAVVQSLSVLVPPILTTETLGRLEDRGLRIAENVMAPGERKQVDFPADLDVLVHRLCGLAVQEESRIDFTVRAESDGRVLLHMPDVPYDKDGGAVLVACQQHYASLPADAVFEVDVHREGSEKEVTRYTVLHRFLSKLSY